MSITVEQKEWKDMSIEERTESKEMSIQLITKYRETGEEQYREQFFDMNIKLANHIAGSYKNTGYTYEELCAEAYFGMVKAFNTFDVEKGFQFATYSARCMHNQILMVLRKKKRDLTELAYLEHEIANDDDGHTLTLSAILPDNDAKVSFESAELRACIQPLLTEMLVLCDQDPVKLAVLENLLKDEDERRRQKDLADELGISQSYLSRIGKVLVKKARALAVDLHLEELIAK